MFCCGEQSTKLNSKLNCVGFWHGSTCRSRSVINRTQNYFFIVHACHQPFYRDQRTKACSMIVCKFDITKKISVKRMSYYVHLANDLVKLQNKMNFITFSPSLFPKFIIFAFSLFSRHSFSGMLTFVNTVFLVRLIFSIC